MAKRDVHEPRGHGDRKIEYAGQGMPMHERGVGMPADRPDEPEPLAPRLVQVRDHLAEVGIRLERVALALTTWPDNPDSEPQEADCDLLSVVSSLERQAGWLQGLALRLETTIGSINEAPNGRD